MKCYSPRFKQERPSSLLLQSGLQRFDNARWGVGGASRIDGISASILCKANGSPTSPTGPIVVISVKTVMPQEGFTTNPLNNGNFGAFSGHGQGYMGPTATTWVPMRAQAHILSPNDHRNPS